MRQTLEHREQQELFARTSGCNRFVYNRMLSDKIDHYNKRKKTLHNTPAQYKGEYPWLKEVDSQALKYACKLKRLRPKER